MTAAVIGLLGIIAGALVTGGVQAWLDARRRRAAGRVAARLLYLQLAWAETAIAEFPGHYADWESFFADWREHRSALASGVKTRDFQLVATAFSVIRQLTLAREAPPPPEFLAVYLAAVQHAQTVTHRASFTRWEWHREGAANWNLRVPTSEALMRLVNEVTGANGANPGATPPPDEPESGR